MASKSAVASPTLSQPLVYSVGPSWLGMVTCAVVAGLMLPWLMAKETVEVSMPLMETWILPAGMPLWVFTAALFFGLLFSIRCRVVIDEKARTLTRWRCICVLLPWSVKTRSFGEVRYVWLGVVTNPLQVLAGEFLSGGDEGERPDSSPTSGGPVGVRVVFHDRDWFNIAMGREKRMVAISEELCELMETRLG